MVPKFEFIINLQTAGQLHRSKELLVVLSYLTAVPKKMWIPTDQVSHSSEIRKIKFAGDKVKFARRRIRFPLQLWLPEALFCEFLHWREKRAAVGPQSMAACSANFVFDPGRTGTERKRRFNKSPRWVKETSVGRVRGVL